MNQLTPFQYQPKMQELEQGSSSYAKSDTESAGFPQIRKGCSFLDQEEVAQPHEIQI
jgi:hypothetical protein